MKTSTAEIVNLGTRKKLSFKRLFLLLLVLGGIGYQAFVFFDQEQAMDFRQDFAPWFAAYVDVTSTPTYVFEKPAFPARPDVMLSFIVAAHEDPCTPTWGTYYTMDQAGRLLDLDRRIARLQQLDGKIAISFGGALNSELGLVCQDHDKLINAYRSVIERYHINTIDLDLENESLQDKDALKRRAEAIAELQQNYREEDKDLAIWLTLPVAPQGLTQDGTDAVAAMIEAGVDLAGVNVMTMDYGGSKDPKDSMFESSKKALIATQRQLGILYKRAGINLNNATLWSKIGATPMIGQNDVADEVFSIEDAIAFNQFATEQGIGRMSMWSANRDIPCGENYVDVTVVSDSCSGTKAPRLAYTKALSAHFDGDLVQNASLLTIEDPVTNEHIIDDQETSPYQIWKADGAYHKGTKVVWHGNVFEAKWWTQNDLPDSPVLQEWETPWRLVGPVLAGEQPIEQPTLPRGTYPEWSGTTVYDAGQRVLFEGTPFQAKWWNRGESPAAAAAHSDNSPWVPLTPKQVVEILENSN